MSRSRVTRSSSARSWAFAPKPVQLDLLRRAAGFGLGARPARAPVSRALRHSAMCERVQALAAQQRPSRPVRPRRQGVVLVEDPGLVLGG